MKKNNSILKKPLKKVIFQTKSLEKNLNKELKEIQKLLRSEKNKEALFLCEKMIISNPESKEISEILGFLYKKINKDEESIKFYSRAISLYEEAIKKNKKESLNYYFLGNIYYSLNSFKKASEYYQKYENFKTNPISSFLNHAKSAYNLSDLSKAKDLCLNHITQNDVDAESSNLLACIYTDLQEMNKAEEYFIISNKFKPTNYLFLTNYATFLQTINKFDEASEVYLKCLNTKYPSITAFHQLSILNPDRISKETIEIMEKNLDNNNLSMKEKSHILFALWEIFSFKKDAGAFKYLENANKFYKNTINSSKQFDKDNHKLFIKKCLASQKKGKKFIDKADVEEATKYSPIFILGMARSGTSLTEQILSNHKNISGCGELSNIQNIYNDNNFFNIEDIKISRSLYINNVSKFFNKSTLGFTDKMPGNFYYIGLINSLFPNAKIIHMKRNPVDTCFSIFTKMFSRGHEYAYNLEDLANYYKLYSGVMDYWKNEFNNIYDLSYEDLVNDTQNQTVNLLKFCNFDFDHNCIKFYKNKRPVLTASKDQVRRKIYKNSINRHRDYYRDLEILNKELADFI
jgi:tetratricopeptide (TPR) repeat protein